MEKDSLILVTGANGYIASHIANEALARNYRVRGTVRNPSATQWLQDFFDERYGKGRFELVKADGFDKEGALDPFLDGMLLAPCASVLQPPCLWKQAHLWLARPLLLSC